MKREPVLAALIVATILAVTPAPACKEAAPIASNLSASEIIAESAATMREIDSFHFEITHEGGGTPIAMGVEMREAEGDVAKPGKLSTEISATMSGILVRVDIITVGTTTYMTNPLTRQWELLPGEFSAISIFDPDAGIVAILEEMTDLTRLDDEKIGTFTCIHIKGEIPCESLRPITLTSVEGVDIDVEVWIDGEEFLLHQIKLDGRITETEKEGIIRYLKLSNFDQEVEIELPE